MFRSHSDHPQGARIFLGEVCRTAVRHTSPNTAHVHTPYVMLPHHHTNVLHF